MQAHVNAAAVERLWNTFEDNLTPKRRSMKNSKLASLVHAAAIMAWLPHDLGQHVDLADYVLFQSLFEAAVQWDDEQAAEAAVRARAAGLGASEGDCDSASEKAVMRAPHVPMISTLTTSCPRSDPMTVSTRGAGCLWPRVSWLGCKSGVCTSSSTRKCPNHPVNATNGKRVNCPVKRK